MVLQTERLILRHFHLDDLDLLIEINNHPDCIRFHRWDSMSEAECRANLERWIAQYGETLPGCGVFCLENREGEKIGMTFLLPYTCDTHSSNSRQVELGFRLRRCHWGKGYASEISRALLRYSEQQLHASAVVGEVLHANTRSCHVFEKLHFQRQPHPDGDDAWLYTYPLSPITDIPKQ